MANKVGRNKKACEKYKLSGREAENKALKQERHKKRMARFAKRKEEGKAYVYRSGHAQEKLKANRARKDYDPVNGVWLANAGSKQPRHGEYNKWKSVMGKLEYQMSKLKAEEMAKIHAAERVHKKGK